MSTSKASTLIELGRHQEALEALDALGEAGLTADAQCLRARALIGLNRLKEAERAAANARAADPGHEWGYRLGAIVARKQLRPKVADGLARQAVQLAPYEPYTHQVCALTAIALGDSQRAFEHSTEMLRLAPHDALSHYTRGLAYKAEGRAADAEAAFRKALSIDPHDAAAMSALADVVGVRDAQQAKELRLAAVRASPHDARHRRQLLKRGGVAGGGALFAAAKLGFVGKLLALNAIRVTAGAVGDDAVVVGALVVAYAIAFAITRFRRWRHGRALPPLMWEGLKAERRNADLMWVAWPAGFVLVGAATAVVFQIVFGHSPVRPLVYAGVAGALLALCWQLRRGEARQLTLGDFARQAGGTVRFLWQRSVASRRRTRRAKPTASALGDTDG